MAAELLNLFRGIETADVSGKRVLIRADLNVPMSGGRSPMRPESKGSCPHFKTFSAAARRLSSCLTSGGQTESRSRNIR